jgi:glycosyltransferase involved in cell wall biosynthesis
MSPGDGAAEHPVVRGRILLAAFDYPPRSYPGTRRARGLAKHLGRLGYEVTVLTSAAGCPVADPGGGERVIRTRDLVATRLNWRRRNIRAQQGVRAATYTTKQSLPSKLLVPDPMVITWLPFAVPKAIAEHRRQPFDCVLTTSPPESTHLIGAALARRGVPWVAELRDGWRFERPRRTWPSRAQARLDGLLERLVLGSADRRTTVSPQVSDDLASRVGLDAVTIGHGYDFEEALDGQGSSGVELDPDRHSIVYTGSMGAAGRSPAALIAALEILRRDAPDVLDRLELVFAGPLSVEEREQLGAPWLSEVVRLLGVLDHDSALGLQREADTLLQISVPGCTGDVAGKLTEYLASSRPIVVLGGDEGARIVGRVGAGRAIPGDDPEAIADGLSDLVSAGHRPGRSGPEQERATREFGFAGVAEQMASLIEAARDEAESG